MDTIGGDNHSKLVLLFWNLLDTECSPARWCPLSDVNVGLQSH